jgi:hypothetical protein
MLEGGEYNSSAELAKAEKVNASYLSRILRLTLLSPDIVAAIVPGRKPSTLQVDDLLRPLPSLWQQQKSTLGRNRHPLADHKQGSVNDRLAGENS